MSSRRLLPLAALVALAALAMLTFGSTSAASGCTITWTGDVNGEWFGGTSGDDTNWSDDTFPDAGDHACLDDTGAPYSVNLGASTTVDHFTIGPQATLAMNGTTLDARADSTNAGTVTLTGGARIRALDGIGSSTETLTNSSTGTIDFPSGGSGGSLDGDIVNQGTISVTNPSAGFGQSGAESRVPTLTNTGTLAVPGGGVFTVTTGILEQAASGTITGPGAVNLGGSSTLRVTGGQIGGSADVNLLTFSGAILAFGATPNSATGNIDVLPGSHPLTGNVPAGITIDIEGGQLRSATNFTNAGTVNVTSTDAGTGQLQALDTNSATIETTTNTGTVNFPSGGSGGSLDGDVSNQGTISVTNAGGRFGQSGAESRVPTLTNTGTLTVPGGGVFTVTTGILEQAAGGTITGPGPVNFGGSSTLRVTGGQIDGSGDVNLTTFADATLAFGTAPNAATGNIGLAQGLKTLTGNVPAGVTLNVEGATLRNATSFTNAGTVNLTADGRLQALDTNAATVETITNTGTVNSPSGTPGGGDLDGDVTNQGTISVGHADAGFGQSGAESRVPTLTNTGTLAVPGGGVFTVTTGILEQAAGGTITGPGAVNLGGSSTLRVTGGQIGGSADVNLLTFSGAILAFGATPNSATGNIDVLPGLHPLTGNVPAGIALDVEGATLRSATSFTNAGTVNLTGNGTLQALDGTAGTIETITNASGATINVPAGTPGGGDLDGDIANQGTISVAHDSSYGQSGAESRTPKLTNAAGGTLTVASGGSFSTAGTQDFETAGTVTVAGTLSSTVNVTGGLFEGTGTVQGALTNGGEVAPGPGVGTLKVTGAYTQGSDGRLSVRVQAPTSDQLDADGPATLDGALAISTGASPAEGDEFEVLDASSRSGEFSQVTGASSGPYDVRYDAAGVTLVTQEPASLPDLSIDDVEIVEGDTGTSTLDFVARLSAAQQSPVTATFATRDGTARAPGDFEAETGTVTFGPGQVERPVSVTVTGDTAPEPDETLEVRLSDPEGARFADEAATGTILNDELELTSVTPTRGGDGGTVQITAHGGGFVPGTSLRLSRAGEADIVATGVQSGSGARFLTGVVDLRGQAQGGWDVTAALPAGRGTPQTLPAAFTIEGNRPADVWIKFTGRDVARPGLPYEGWLAYGNTGNVDATGVTIEVTGLSAFDRLRLPFNAPDGLLSRDGAAGRLTFYLDRLGPGSTRYVPFEPRFAAGPNVNLRARIVPNTYDPAAVPQIDPAAGITSTVTEQTPGSIKGVHSISGTPGGDIQYDYQAGPSSGPASRTIDRTEPSQGVQQYRLRGVTETSPGQFLAFDYSLTGPAAAFEGLERARGPLPSTGVRGRGVAARVGPDDLVDALGASADSIKLVTQAELIDCLTTRGYITRDQGAKALHEAEGKAIIGVLKLAPVPGGPAGDLTWDTVTDLGGVALDTMSKDTITDALRDNIVSDQPPNLGNRIPEELQSGNSSIFTDDVLYEYAIKECKPEPPNPDLEPPPPGGTGGSPPPAPGGGGATQEIRIVNSRDPNEKQGPQGAGAERFIEGDRPLAYTVSFENVDTATAAAQEVRIADQLDPSKLDLSTVELGPVTFGDTYVPVPPGLRSYTTDVDLRPANDLIVRVEGDLDETTGLLEWTFRSIDPATGVPTTDPEAGFLPPNDSPREGEGSVSFSASPVSGLADGTQVSNSASIVFDVNEPILTNTWLNTIDRNPPTSGVTSVDRANGKAGCPTSLTVAWSGSDAGSGVAGYDVYVSAADEPFRLWQIGASTTRGTFVGQANTSYRFFSIARDRAGHVQSSPYAPVVQGSTGACSAAAPPSVAPPSATPPATPPPSGSAAGRLRLLTRGARLDRGRRLALAVRCVGAQGARCRGRLRLFRVVRSGKGRRARTRTVGAASLDYSLAAGRRVVLRPRIGRKAVRLINRRGRLELRARATPNGARAVSLGRVAARPRRRR